MTAVLEMQQVKIAYGSNVLLPNVSFNLSAGQVCVLTGPNGSGKTSLLRAALGIGRRAGGRVRMDFNRPAYVPQFQVVDRQFPCSVRDVLRMSFSGARYTLQSRLRSRRDQRVEEILEEIGLSHRGDQQLRDCSGGEIQRAMLGRALALDPDILLLDEPTASLDTQGKDMLLALLGRLNAEQGLTIWMTSHEIDRWNDLITQKMTIGTDGHFQIDKLRGSGDV